VAAGGKTVVLHYTDGGFTLGSTRGDGTRGEDITLNLRTVQALPLRVPVAGVEESGLEAPARLVVRGEAYMPIDAFEAFNRAQEAAGGKTYANPRNTAAGSLRVLDSAVTASRPMGHPLEEDLNYLYGTIFIAPPRTESAGSRNVCVFADGQVDRSPTGTGVSGRAAIHHARGELAPGETITIESLIGTRFDVSVVRTTTLGELPAIVPEVTGSASITGRHEFLIDPADPLREGFLLR